MTAPTLILGGVPISLVAGLELRQTYQTIGGVETLRLTDGAAVRQEHWSRLRTVVQGTGWAPEALETVDYSAAQILDCIAPRAVSGPGNVLTLPAARRADAGHQPLGFALLGGLPRSVGLSITGDQATLETVAGASAYVCWYYPRLTVFADRPEAVFDRAAGAWTWILEAEEI